jgi:hypothetical protein
MLRQSPSCADGDQTDDGSSKSCSRCEEAAEATTKDLEDQASK